MSIMWGRLFLPKPKFYEEYIEKMEEQSGKTFAITGTTSGLGFVIAETLVAKNADAVFMLNRKSIRSESSFKKLLDFKKSSNSKTEIVLVECDLMSFKSVRQASAKVLKESKRFGGLNVLSANAGITAFPEERTEDGFDIQAQVNLLSHYLLMKLLMPALKQKYDAGGEVRIVQQTSGTRMMSPNLDSKYFTKTHAKKMFLGGNGIISSLKRYAQTKMAIICFGMKIADILNGNKEIDSKRFKSVVAEPGASDSDGGPNIVKAHEKYGFFHSLKWKAYVLILQLLVFVIPMQKARDGALCMLHGMVGDGVSNGDFFIPEKKTIGKPFKDIDEGKTVSNSRVDESAAVDARNKNLVIEILKKEIGDLF